MITNWKQIAGVVGSFLMTLSPYIAAMEHWDDLWTTIGVAGLLTVLGGWLLGLATYTHDNQWGSPEKKP